MPCPVDYIFKHWGMIRNAFLWYDRDKRVLNLENIVYNKNDNQN